MIETHLHDDVLEIVMNNPPVNALGLGLREGIDKALRSALADDKVKAVVIRGAGKLFSGGADITEFGRPHAAPHLPNLINSIEASAKPVVAAIHGMALGGGLEIAMGCHYRLAVHAAKLGLPEVTLGILPGAGGTQRLPRLAGVDAALNMIVSGTPISGEKAAALGLVDQLAPEATLLEQAIAFARAAKAPRRTRDVPLTAEDDVFERFSVENARKIAGLDAPRACIEAVKAATEMPFDDGLAKEAALFDALVDGDQSKALRHVFFAERAAAKISDLPKDTQLRAIKKVGVIGAGTMGGGISMNFLSAGIPVTIVDMGQDALERGVGVVRKNYEASASKGRMTQAQVESAMALLTSTVDFNALADCDLVIEAVYENMEVKKQIFARLDGVAKPGAMLASNTSFLNVDEIASATGRPSDVLGLHFFSPANVMKLVEVVRGASTAPDALATGMEIARRIGKVPVVAGVCYGFIGNRMLLPRQANAEALLLEGATPEQVDRVHTNFGMPMGPFQMADLAGVDIGWHRDPARVETLQDALCAQGRWGQKKQAGYYDYDAKRKPTPSPIVAGIVADFRRKAGIVPRLISDEEIVVRTLYTMVNEGAKILEEGFAQRASDIDVVWVYGYGWPRHKGGPMFWGDQVGVSNIVSALERNADRLGTGFTLSPLLKRLVTEGGKLGG
ncbi:3-hydroxyacyl-CoA dehydrogenase NAD-binding domain-containing protein [Mesorhizobium australafricanum]|uniref:3-hydroxyacyl-CoA dehydrogenase NAD-binding domain-containing protein n=1 Tax=Mesorhizobium australafricanum TaxID=3072311 RepID=A0ABU4X725_9HYPH|nr:3-hydroxyacyl-CoA dehydrogenase NAD-binding domain-containing protein [Mesorhizobium sp. VK3E]MDX8443318.1 3-hydroxyacyl-CoA dehydrogenase NAD-binding domain-containing protein [Mesorhizobium sp. VK3E]